MVLSVRLVSDLTMLRVLRRGTSSTIASRSSSSSRSISRWRRRSFRRRSRSSSRTSSSALSRSCSSRSSRSASSAARRRSSRARKTLLRPVPVRAGVPSALRLRAYGEMGVPICRRVVNDEADGIGVCNGQHRTGHLVRRTRCARFGSVRPIASSASRMRSASFVGSCVSSRVRSRSTSSLLMKPFSGSHTSCRFRARPGSRLKDEVRGELWRTLCSAGTNPPVVERPHPPRLGSSDSCPIERLLESSREPRGEAAV